MPVRYGRAFGMQEIDVSMIPRWNSTSGWYYPQSIDLACPGCKRNPANFRISTPMVDTRRNYVSAVGSCAACQITIKIWAIGTTGNLDEIKDGSKGVVAVHPSPAQSRQPIAGQEHIPPKIQRAYQAMLRAYNSREWDFTLTGCRRTLEGINACYIPKEKRVTNLFKNLELLPNYVSMSEPLVELAHTLRESGNLGAHFDDEKESDEEIATAAIDLVEYFLEYLFVLPNQVRELRAKLDLLDAEEAAKEI